MPSSSSSPGPPRGSPLGGQPGEESASWGGAAGRPSEQQRQQQQPSGWGQAWDWGQPEPYSEWGGAAEIPERGEGGGPSSASEEGAEAGEWRARGRFSPGDEGSYASTSSSSSPNSGSYYSVGGGGQREFFADTSGGRGGDGQYSGRYGGQYRTDVLPSDIVLLGNRDMVCGGGICPV